MAIGNGELHGDFRVAGVTMAVHPPMGLWTDRIRVLANGALPVM